MWRMTTAAALRLHGYVLIDERTPLVGMAVDANRVAGWHRSDLANRGRAMDVVAIAAPNQTFVDSMVIGLGKVGFCRRMTSVAKTRLRLCQEVLRVLGMVR